jgi:N-acetylglucosaminyl-diphospho-decaprenol L-rhamnosyltransferase
VASDALGVAVLAYGDDREFEPLIESLLAEGVPAASILLVHNPARPGEAAPSVASGCELIQTGRNLGYAGGMNVAVARLLERGAELLLLLTHDARLRPGALDTLLSVAARQPDLGLIAPVLLLIGTEVPYSFGGRTSPSGANSHRKEPPAGDEDILLCDWIDGGTMLVRREVFERVGDFDERFWGYCEEADLCLRARRSGFSAGVVVAARADQAPGASKRLGAWAYLMSRNGIEYGRRFAGVRGLAARTAAAFWLVVVSLLRTALRGLHLRPGAPAEPWALAVGTARGAVDRYRGRWGPPPPNLPGMGDLSNA